MLVSKSIPSGTRVRVVNAGPVPQWSTWDDDKQRTSTPNKRRLQQMFFRGDKKISASVVFISSEHERETLKKSGRVKVELRDPAGSMIVITADAANLKPA